MARFENLEFGTPESLAPETRLKGRDSVHDEHYWMSQADTERRNGCFENALRYYSRALELDRSIVCAWAGQVQMLIAMGEFPEAEIWSKKANELFRDNPELIATRAHALIRRRDLSNAQPLCDAAISGVGKSYYPWIVRGEFMLASGDQMDQHCFDKARQLCPDWLVNLEIADAYTFFHRSAKALMYLRAAAESAPDRAYLWFRLGTCERSMDLAAAARNSLRRCVELEPGHLEARRALEDMSRTPPSFLGMFRRLFRRN